MSHGSLMYCNCPSLRLVMNSTAGASPLSGLSLALIAHPQVPSETFRSSIQMSATFNVI